MAATFFGGLQQVTIADLQNLVSDINRKGDGRAQSANALNSVAPGSPSIGGKKASTKVAVDIGAGAIAVVMALGEKSSDLWRVIDGGTAYTPVNILNVGGGGAWTLTTATYAAGVLTSATAAAINATQTVVLKAGRYKISGTVGRRVSTVWPVLVVTQVTGSVTLLNKAYNTAKLDAASVVTDALSDTFVLPIDSSVKFDLNVKDINGNQTGATFISFNLEANG